jgi:peptidoglycan/xylan/chitin deacetylase (PgdA/CDA1 family)
VAVSNLAVSLSTRPSVVAFMERFVRGNAFSQGNTTRAAVALTFDDGPHPLWTPKILDALDAARVRATFFVVGQFARALPDIVREARRRGHEIGTHLDSHQRDTVEDPLRFRDEVQRSLHALEDILGERVRWLRFPYGHRGCIDPRAAFREYGLRTVHWTYSSHDTHEREPKRIVARVAAGLRPGAILLLHDRLADAERGISSRYQVDRGATVAALPRIGERLAARGLSGVTVGELLADRVNAA